MNEQLCCFPQPWAISLNLENKLSSKYFTEKLITYFMHQISEFENDHFTTYVSSWLEMFLFLVVIFLHYFRSRLHLTRLKTNCQLAFICYYMQMFRKSQSGLFVFSLQGAPFWNWNWKSFSILLFYFSLFTFLYILLESNWSQVKSQIEYTS